MSDDTDERDAEYANRIEDEAMHGDNECDHSAADDILCDLLMELGYSRTVDAWQQVGKWYA